MFIITFNGHEAKTRYFATSAFDMWFSIIPHKQHQWLFKSVKDEGLMVSQIESNASVSGRQKTLSDIRGKGFKTCHRKVLTGAAEEFAALPDRNLPLSIRPDFVIVPNIV